MTTPVLSCLTVLLTAMQLAAQPTTLRQAAAPQGIPIGAAASADEYGETSPLLNPSYANLLSGQYSMLEPGNAMKWDVTQPTQTTYNFEPGDELVAFAQANQMRVRGHNLCWYTQFPSWLQPYAATATPAQMATLLQNHITTEVTHYAGQVFAWDVVNEAFDDSSAAALRDSIWYNQPGIGQTGTGYIAQAFQWAHAADPSALLFYNDYNIEEPGPKFDAVLSMVQDFVNNGVPINGVGFEMHVLNTYYPSATQLAQNMQALAALGLQVHITEMDVRLPVDASGNASAADLQTQAQIYQSIMTVCLQQPNCTAFQVWGVSYNDSWIPSVFPGYGAALPFDFNFNPTPAFSALMTAMQTTTTPPSLRVSNLVNAASYRGGPVAPGEIVTVYDSTYGPASLVLGQPDSTGKFPTNVGGVQVLFDGVPAPLLYASANSGVGAIVPFEVAGKQQTVVEYQYNPGSGAVVSNTATLPVAAAAPAIFALNESGSGPGAILNLDYTVNSASNPVAAGGYIQVFGTGGGAIVGGATDGAPAPGIANLVTQPVTATIGGVAAKVVYAGTAPGLVNGAMQVDLQIPAGLTPGPQPVVITVGTAVSQSGITVAVQ